MDYKLSPSDFAYLYEECKLCYCLKIKQGIYQPSMPMPGVFSAINTRLQGKLVGINLKELSSDLPDGEVIAQEGWVESILVPDTSVFIKGKYDLLVKNPDGTHTLVDLKISQQSDDKIDKYKTQLTAYKFALENPKSGNPISITKIALLIFYPDQVTFRNNIADVGFPPKWLEVPIDESTFFTFIKEVDNLLIGPLPKESINCKWCQYRHINETLISDKNTQDIPF
ncbi:PD-(D/E)XK nuclease family protein [Candidatus Woesebacteria bacterium]|nr:MAG: PD-(D/E)XK nuclease family protein [Candidatus Woesebacteria bacterium]